ncbi:MAG: hypothetical protein DHS20C17_14470 [Cyclobacteriaceae bacterium]|nr:MAG: hypothetical protein DHS20C17_14470 [Cyclobacteriaceae bacterium]
MSFERLLSRIIQRIQNLDPRVNPEKTSLVIEVELCGNLIADNFSGNDFAILKKSTIILKLAICLSAGGLTPSPKLKLQTQTSNSNFKLNMPLAHPDSYREVSS